MPTSDTNRYKIIEQDTTGWSVVPEAQNLTKEECDVKLNEFVRLGANPNALKAVLQDDRRFPNPPTDPGYIPVN
jgi:hypothetical protein|tara:strand:- start:527 stop:748 length:222 start_codon:yes stop_codon:yes gene_type:complete